MGAQPSTTERAGSLGWQGTLAAFGSILLLAGGLYFALYQDAVYSLDPPIFAEIYHHAVEVRPGWPNHHYLHFLGWRLAYAVSGDVWDSLDAATWVPAALASAGLWLFLVRRRGASPVVAAVLSGAVSGCANVLFFATTIEVHATQWFATVLALWPIDVARCTSSAARRWCALALIGALLLLAHPLHALWLPLVSVHVATRVRRPGERPLATLARLGAIAALFGAIAALRYWDIERRLGWTVESLDSWGAGTRWATVFGDLWNCLVRAHIAVFAIVVIYLARGRGDGAWLRWTQTILWLVPLAGFVSYLGLFEAGGYFVSLGTLFVGLFARDSILLLERGLGQRSAILAPPAFLASLVVSALLSGAWGLRQAHDPPLSTSAQVVLDFVRREVPAQGHLVCFESELSESLRLRARRSVTGALGPILARLPEEFDAQLSGEIRKYVQHKLEIGATVWYFRPESPLVGPDSRRAALDSHFEAWFVGELGAPKVQIPGVLAFGPVQAPAHGP